MGIKTKIEFADSTINPVMGCTGCELYHSDPKQNHCYAARLVNRHAGQKGWPKAFNRPEYFLERMEKALQWPDLTGKRREDEPWLNGYPRIIFVNDLSDGFCPDVDPKVWLEPFMKRMRESPHIWLLLTKWPKQMAAFFNQYYRVPSNFWLGVSVPNQKAIWRVQDLQSIRASVRLLSLEPLLEPLSLVNMLCVCSARFGAKYTCECGHHHSCGASPHRHKTFSASLDGVFLGGESGHNARPMHPAWARLVRDQCQAIGIPLLMKQWGAWFPRSQWEDNPDLILPDDDRCVEGRDLKILNDDIMHHVGKGVAGRELDGVLWNEMPNVT